MQEHYIGPSLGPKILRYVQNYQSVQNSLFTNEIFSPIHR